MKKIEFDDGMVMELKADGDTIRLYWAGHRTEFHFKISHDAILVAERIRAGVRLLADQPQVQ